LACEQTSWKPLGVSIALATFNLLAEVFDLPAVTLHAFSNYGGTCFKSLSDEQGGLKRRKLGMQMFQNDSDTDILT